jgi:tetratricopeptide (TPR) repeat protein
VEANGQLRQAADKYAEGITLAARAGVVGETPSKLRRRLALAHMKLRDYERALTGFQDILRDDPQDDGIRYFLVELYLRQGRAVNAEVELEQLLKRYEYAPRDAESMLTTLAQEFPDQVFLTRHLAQVHAALGETQQAIQLLDEMGERLLNAGRNQEAVGVIEDIIALNPPQVQDYRRLLAELREPLTETNIE